MNQYGRYYFPNHFTDIQGVSTLSLVQKNAKRCEEYKEAQDGIVVSGVFISGYRVKISTSEKKGKSNDLIPNHRILSIEDLESVRRKRQCGKGSLKYFTEGGGQACAVKGEQNGVMCRQRQGKQKIKDETVYFLYRTK